MKERKKKISGFAKLAVATWKRRERKKWKEIKSKILPLNTLASSAFIEIICIQCVFRKNTFIQIKFTFEMSQLIQIECGQSCLIKMSTFFKKHNKFTIWNTTDDRWSNVFFFFKELIVKKLSSDTFKNGFAKCIRK